MNNKSKLKKPKFPPNRIVMDDGGGLYYLILPLVCFTIPVILLISLLF